MDIIAQWAEAYQVLAEVEACREAGEPLSEMTERSLAALLEEMEKFHVPGSPDPQKVVAAEGVAAERERIKAWLAERREMSRETAALHRDFLRFLEGTA